MKQCLCLIISLFIFQKAHSKDEISEHLSQFVLGQYHLIGKAPDSSRTYAGQLEIYEQDQQLKIKRIINEQEILGTAAIESALHGESHVLRMRFNENNQSFETTCLIRSDLDNYARISCYLYQPGVRTKEPGLEALFINHSRD
ncbi:hypothetical protein [Litoribacillus peritrichatus]|uniref:Uncharacterized protein n=1 Tax=Litoribacillus peritrichatus TaxID=718191 RepID=A0ABP7NA75_9GAMM